MHEKTRENRLRRQARRRGLSLIKYRNGAGFGLIDVDTNGLSSVTATMSASATTSTSSKAS